MKGIKCHDLFVREFATNMHSSPSIWAVKWRHPHRTCLLVGKKPHEMSDRVWHALLLVIGLECKLGAQTGRKMAVIAISIRLDHLSERIGSFVGS